MYICRGNLKWLPILVPWVFEDNMKSIYWKVWPKSSNLTQKWWKLKVSSNHKMWHSISPFSPHSWANNASVWIICPFQRLPVCSTKLCAYFIIKWNNNQTQLGQLMNLSCYNNSFMYCSLEVDLCYFSWKCFKNQATLLSQPRDTVRTSSFTFSSSH